MTLCVTTSLPEASRYYTVIFTVIGKLLGVILISLKFTFIEIGFHFLRILGLVIGEIVEENFFCPFLLKKEKN